MTHILQKHTFFEEIHVFVEIAWFCVGFVKNISKTPLPCETHMTVYDARESTRVCTSVPKRMKNAAFCIKTLVNLQGKNRQLPKKYFCKNREIIIT